MKHSGYNSGNLQANYKYKFIGRELQDELGLNMYDLRARQYDPAIARFVTIDPLTDEVEQLDKSNYAYAWNDPIKYNDPDGECPNCVTALFGALIGGGIELGGQLLSGKSLNEVDWADVGVETLKGGLIGSGVGAGAATLIEGGSVIAKASFDYTGKGGAKTVVDGTKSVGSATFDAAADVVAGKIGGALGRKIGGLTENSVKQSVKAETKATKELVQATNKFNKLTDGGKNASTVASNILDKAKSASGVARVNTVKTQMANSATKGVSGTVVNKAAQNTVVDKVKNFFGF